MDRRQKLAKSVVAIGVEIPNDPDANDVNPEEIKLDQIQKYLESAGGRDSVKGAQRELKRREKKRSPANVYKIIKARLPYPGDVDEKAIIEKIKDVMETDPVTPMNSDYRPKG